MVNTQKKRTVKEDRLSKLPPELINFILDRLPYEEAVRTSILSTTWRYTWTMGTSLILDGSFVQRFIRHGRFLTNDFKKAINKAINCHGPQILKFHLYVPPIFLNIFNGIEELMLVLSKKNVRELFFVNTNERYELPSHIFSCSNIIRMRLEKFVFSPPLRSHGFGKLADLYLKDIDFGVNSRGTLDLPQLKKFALEWCTNAHNLNIKAKKLEVLLVITSPGVRLLQLLESPYMKVTGLFLEKELQNPTRAEKVKMEMLLKYIQNVETFYVDGLYIQCFIAEKVLKSLPQPLMNLRRFGLLDIKLADWDHLRGVLCVLWNSPNLESLYVQQAEGTEVMQFDEALNCLQAPGCLGGRTLNALKRVDIVAVEGTKSELLFIKLLLRLSPSLQTLTIYPSKGADANKQLEIVKQVLRCARASPEAQVLCEDIMPPFYKMVSAR